MREGETVETDPDGNGGMSEDQDVNLISDPHWKKTPMGWNVVPWGCRKMLHWIDQRYDHPEIVITENGCTCDDQLVEGTVEDVDRVEFLRLYLEECQQAIEEGVQLRGYFAWSFMDNFEWALGFPQRFGLNYVDYKTGKRYPKASAKWYSDWIRNHSN